MSNISTNGINSSYPVPGVNNSTQGFRDNFTSIKTNLATAATEITDLQTKVVVKAALSDTSLNNDMGNTLISNAAVRSFRATTYNLGNSIPSSLTIDVSQGDVQYGTITQNTAITFAGWSPAGTQSNIQLMLNVSNSSAVISFPDTYHNASNVVISGMKPSVRILENYSSNVSAPAANSVYTNKVSTPLGVTEVQYRFHSTDCGATIDVEPINRGVTPSTIAIRTPSANGNVGDVKGSMCTDGTKLYVCTDSYGTANISTTGASGNGTYSTLTFAAQPVAPYKVGATITVAGVTPAGYNGSKTVSACTTTSVTFASTTTGSQTVAGTISGARVIWGSVALTAVP